jgi:hypothetical protein
MRATLLKAGSPPPSGILTPIQYAVISRAPPFEEPGYTPWAIQKCIYNEIIPRVDETGSYLTGKDL